MQLTDSYVTSAHVYAGGGGTDRTKTGLPPVRSHLAGPNNDHRQRWEYNDVRSWGNHGLHYSGAGFELVGNTVRSAASWALGYPITVGDSKTPYNCTAIATVTDNTITPEKGVYIGAGFNHPSHDALGRPNYWTLTGNTDQYGNALSSPTTDVDGSGSSHCA